MKIINVLLTFTGVGIILGGLVYVGWTLVATERKLKARIKNYPKAGKVTDFRFDNRISKQIELDDFENRLS